MRENVYECLFLLDSNKYARNPAGVSGKLPEAIENAGGEVLANRLWGEQKLAYPIEGHKKGVYWLTYFRMPTDQLKGFNRACQLNEDILRQLVIKVEPRLVDVLVSHAKGAAVASPAEETESDEASKEAGGEDTKASEAEAEPVAAAEDDA